MKRSTQELQEIIEKHMPGFQVVEDADVDAPARDVATDEATPDILEMRKPHSESVTTRERVGIIDRLRVWRHADGSGGEAEPGEAEDQFVRIVPKDLADSPAATRHTKVVLVSGEGKIIAEQG